MNAGGVALHGSHDLTSAAPAPARYDARPMVRPGSGIPIALACLGGCATPAPGEGTTPSSAKPSPGSSSAAPRVPAASSGAASVMSVGVGSAKPGPPAPAPPFGRLDDI